MSYYTPPPPEYTSPQSGFVQPSAPPPSFVQPQPGFMQQPSSGFMQQPSPGFVQPQPQTVVIMGQPPPPQPPPQMLVVAAQSTQPVCRHCGKPYAPVSEHYCGGNAWLAGCLIGWFCLPLACLPLCVESLQDTRTVCSNCRRVV